MIQLRTSQGVKKILTHFNINVDALQCALTFILNVYAPTYTKHPSIKIVGRKCNKNFGIYEFNTRKIIICANTLTTREYVLSTILHEFRHWIQHNIDGVPPSIIADTHLEYNKNAYEQQCCQFEKYYTQLEQLLTIYQEVINENI